MTTFARTSLNYAPRERGEGLGRAPVEVDVIDARAANLPGWRECGFELVRHTPSPVDWHDDDAIAAVHYPDVEQLARELTGADYALLSDHVKRTPDRSRTPDGSRPREQAPVSLVHSDFSATYDEFVRTAYLDVRGRGAATLERNGISGADVERASRIVMMQFWRNLGEPRMDYPLAFCDARTLTLDDGRPFRYTGYAAGGRQFDALGIVAPERASKHGWYVYPDMTRDEVVAFRTYDTELVRRGEVFFTPHSAFRDPSVEPGNPARFSIELRVACLFA